MKTHTKSGVASYSKEPEIALYLPACFQHRPFYYLRMLKLDCDALMDFMRNVYDDKVDDLLEYFEVTCIRKYRRNAPRQAPLFVINLWKCTAEQTSFQKLTAVWKGDIVVFKDIFPHVSQHFGGF